MKITKNLIIVCSVSIFLLSCSMFSEQTLFDAKGYDLVAKVRQYWKERDGDKFREELNAFLKQTTGKVVKGWECKQMALDYCQSKENIMYHFISFDRDQKRFPNDNITFSGIIKYTEEFDQYKPFSVDFESVTIEEAK